MDDTVEALKKLSNELLLEEYKEAVDDYSRGVSSKWLLTRQQIDDAMTVAASRDYVHEVIAELTARNLKYPVESLKELDLEWQAWLKERVAIDLSDHGPIYSNDLISKNEWWWWLESVDKLTDDQLSTL